MKQFEIQSGDLELLALGLLNQEQEETLMSAINDNAELKKEYNSIENSLYHMAKENEVSASHIAKPIISKIKLEQESFVSFYKRPYVKLAASILILGSVMANIFLLQEKNTGFESSNNEKNQVNDQFLAQLPFEKEVFEEMFNFLHLSLEESPCEMNYKMTKEFLVKNDLNNSEVFRFFEENGGHCDCEVLMNVSQKFSSDVYKHGSEPSVSHRSAHIKLSSYSSSLKNSEGKSLRLISLLQL